VDLSMCGNKADFLDRYRGNVAINVKYRGDPKLSKETLAQLSALDGATRDTVVRFAEEALRETWWATMQERSRELGLGDLWSDGRSGGWLVFKMTISQLEDKIYEAERHCRNCDVTFEQHVDGKCLFDSSPFSSDAPEHLALWETFRTFSSEVKDSLQSVGDNFEEEVLFQLENLDDYTTGLPPLGGSEANPAAFEENADEEAGP